MERGRALRYLIRFELARREGDDPGGRDARLADLIEAAWSASGPPLVLGLDCDGDAFPDQAPDGELMAAVLGGECDCRLVLDSGEARTLPAQAGERVRGGSREW